MKKVVFILLTIFHLGAVSCQSEPKDSESSKEAVKGSTESRLAYEATFNTKPRNGKLKGVVELGASGFNSFIINVDKDLNWEAVKKEYGNSNILEGGTDSQKVSTKLKAYIKKMVDFGVGAKDIHFVVSSGAAKEETSENIIQELKKLDYKVNIVTAEEEGVYALKAVLPNGFSDTSFVVDIGSGNTKISYIEEDNSIKVFESYGAKYYKKDIQDKIAYNEVKSNATKVPKFKRSTCFIIGGAPYKLAKHSRKDKERYTLLSTEVDDYLGLAEKSQKIKSGLNIYKAIIDATDTKKVIFDWHANFTIGFLLSETD